MRDINELPEQTALLAQYEPWVIMQAARAVRSHPRVDVDDLLQIGRLAILEAKERHDGRAGFITYASMIVRDRMRAHLMSFTYPMRLPHQAYCRRGVHADRAPICTLPLDAPSDLDSKGSLRDTLAAPAAEVMLSEMPDLVSQVNKALAKLNRQQQRVIHARFMEEKNLATVAAEMGMSRSRIHQIERTALQILRADRTLKRA